MAQPPEAKKYRDSGLGASSDLRAEPRKTPPQFAKSPMLSCLGRIQADYLMRSHQKGSRIPLSLGGAWHCPGSFSAPGSHSITYRIPCRPCHIGVTCMQPAATPSRSHFASIDRQSKGLDWPVCLQTFPAPWNPPLKNHLG